MAAGFYLQHPAYAFLAYGLVSPEFLFGNLSTLKTVIVAHSILFFRYTNIATSAEIQQGHCAVDTIAEKWKSQKQKANPANQPLHMVYYLIFFPPPLSLPAPSYYSYDARRPAAMQHNGRGTYADRHVSYQWNCCCILNNHHTANTVQGRTAR